MLEHVLSTCRPVASRLCSLLSTVDLCSLGVVFGENEEIRQAVRQELLGRRKEISFYLYFEPRGFGFDADGYFADISEIHLPKCASKILNRVRFTKNQIEWLLGSDLPHVYVSRVCVHMYHAREFDIGENGAAVCSEMEKRYSDSLFIVHVSVDLAAVDLCAQDVRAQDALVRDLRAREAGLRARVSKIFNVFTRISKNWEGYATPISMCGKRCVGCVNIIF